MGGAGAARRSGNYGAPSSAGRCGGENRQLSLESTLVGGSRLAAGDIGGEVRVFFQYIRTLQPAQHRHHQQITGAERAIEPIGIAKVTGKTVQPLPYVFFQGMQALLIPGLVAFEDPGKGALENRKTIERAKGILMRRTGSSEQEAYRILQRTSQDRSVPMVEIARAVLASEPGLQENAKEK